jgi:hypothetical protein
MEIGKMVNEKVMGSSHGLTGKILREIGLKMPEKAMEC